MVPVRSICYALRAAPNLPILYMCARGRRLGQLGRIGLRRFEPPESRVSPLCLGAMMFGAWGNPDHDEAIRDHPPRARRGDQLHRHRRRLLARASRRRSSARRWPAAGATTSCSPPRSTARWATTPTSSATRAAGSSARSRTACGGSAPTGSTSTRSTAPRPTPTSTRRSARSPTSSAPARSATSAPRPSRRRQIVEAQWVAESAAASASSASSRRTRSSSAAIENDVLPTCQRYGMGVIPWSPLAGGWLSGRYRLGRRTCRARTARERIPSRYDMSLPGQPAQARGRRRARPARRRGRDHADRDGARVRDPPPGGDRGDHRPAHDGAPRVPADRRRRRAVRRRARPDRRDRPAGDERQPRPTAAGRTRRWSPRRAGGRAVGETAAVGR